MKFNKKRVVTTYIASTLLFSLFLTGCSLDEAVYNAGRLLGLDMHSSDYYTDVEIEYYDDTNTDKIIEDIVDEIAETTEYVNEKIKRPDINDSNSNEASDETAVDSSDIFIPATDDYDNKIFYRASNDPNKVTISFVGDFCLTEGSSVLGYMKNHDYNPANSFDESLFSRMTGSDIFLLNNEFPYSHGGSPLEGKQYTLRANPDDAVLLNAMGADIVGLANNHCYDYGPSALMDTFSTLKEIGMPYVGAGQNIQEASKPAYFNINGKTIAIIAATQIEGYANPETKEATENSCGVLRCLDTSRVESIISEAKEKSDFVICYIHWGTERYDLIRDWQKSNAIKMANAGADLIVGAHSHCLQGIDYIGDRKIPVCYSLGNFLFNSNTQDTALLTLTLDTSCVDAVDIDSLQFVPCIQSGGRTVEASADDWNRIIRYEQGISYHALLDDQGFITYTEQNMNTQNGRNTSPMRQEDDE